MKKLLVVYLKREQESITIREIEIEDKLEIFYDMLECEYIDIISRKINDKYYDFIIDDEGLLNDKPVTLFNENEVLVGSIIICGTADEDGNLTSLSETESREIVKHFLKDDLTYEI